LNVGPFEIGNASRPHADDAIPSPTSSSRSNGSFEGRSSLLMKTITGVLRNAQTSISLRVWVSTPLGAVDDDD